MKFKHLSLVLMLGAFFPLLTTNAAKIQNLTVNGTDDNLNLLWDALSSSDFGSADGYAYQFSDRQSDVQITKSISGYQNADDVSLRRGSFENNTYYYARVYTYAINDDNDKVLGNGSDMLKFKIDYNHNVTAEHIAITDPVISTETVAKADLFSVFTIPLKVK